MIVKVKYVDIADRGVLGWLHQLPEDRQYVDMRPKDMTKDGGPRNTLVNYGRGFIITDESDPLFIEFKKKFPNTYFEIIIDKNDENKEQNIHKNL